MERKLGINIDCLCFRKTDELTTLKLIRDVGFDCFFTNTYRDEAVAKIKEEADRLGLDFKFIHSPFRGINTFWEEGDGYLPLMNTIKESIDSASKCGINMIIMHTSSGWHPPKVCDLGLSRFDEIVDYATKRDVKVAFENLRKVGNHACLMERYEDNPLVGFCYDAGHEHCYTETVPYIDIYHRVMLTTHIADNLGRDRANLEADGDFHWLPFDGNCDYKKMIDKMDRFGYTDSLNLEVFNTTRPEYKEMTDEEFIKTAYDRIKKISLL